MSTIKYRTNTSGNNIEPIQVERESEQCIWIKGRRESKHSQWWTHHDTWEDARTFLLKRRESEISSIKYRLTEAEKSLEEVRNLQPPVAP